MLDSKGQVCYNTICSMIWRGGRVVEDAALEML